MFNSNTQFSKVALLTAVLALFSTHSAAEIYKWRDARGVTKYSDVPPPFAFTKATRNEIVNALQAKDVCVLPSKTSPQTAKQLSASASTINLEASSFANRSANINTQNSGTNNTKRVNTTGIFSNISSDNKGGTSSNRGGSSGGGSSSSSSGSSSSSPIRLAQNGPAPTAASKSAATSTVVPSKAENIKSSNTETKPTTAAASTVSNSAKPVTVNVPPIQTVAQTIPAGSADNTLTTNIVQVAQMPAVDISKNISQTIGFNEKRIVASNLAKDQPAAGDGDGQFRIKCDVSHMANDDPIVYPNQPGAAHHHTFFGNTSINYKSDLSNLSIAGNSTCMGGIANRSAYWVPSMIDTSSNTPLKPIFALWYYKTGYIVPRQQITAPPKGLRMITGNMKSTTALLGKSPEFTCFKDGDYSSWSEKNIPSCKKGRIIVEHITFPQCWDGINLDSPDHKSHMAEADITLSTPNKCPSSHPIAIPVISLNIQYEITAAEGTSNWRLSSDNYAVNGYNAGYSVHADWVNGWDEKVMAGIVKNCLNAGKECGSHMLGDGTVIY
jgi:Domain of unknown function (DUF1996)/Domain of unknown function (DUF4124)